uniref:DNA replication licensing factor MCM6 n=1 Tax=Glossina morsitans morsitans TaxID=37546 RepID=A0A1B0FHJ7_GLOMM
MDVADAQIGQLRAKDEVGIRCQKLFQDFLEEFKEEGEIKYIKPAADLELPDRCTLEVSFDDVEKYNQNLATTIIEEYYRYYDVHMLQVYFNLIYPYLCQSVLNFIKDRVGLKADKECYVSFTEVPTRHKVRDLITSKIGTLIRISGQVVRTHPVHPELVLGTFMCLDCQTEIRNVEQQFKFTNPSICRNPVCSNRRRFMLNVEKSLFVDFQKVRIQETQSELPRGCIPRSVEIILRSEIVETVQAGDRYDFTGTLIVVPDVGVLNMPGAKADHGSRHKPGEAPEGLTGLKALAKAGVRATLNARTSILAAANPVNGRYDRSKSLQQNIQLSAPIMSRFDLFFVLVDECNEVVDYAIARKIVDLHSNIEDAIERVYSREEVLRYVTFARQFKPFISPEASKLLVENYGHLRQRDTGTAGRSTWRITVRQLESMIRLSEAMAKLECMNEVQERHVREAFRLLNKSIIRIEQPDIHLEEEEDEAFAGDIEMREISGEDNQENSDLNQQEQGGQKKKLTLSFEDYKNLSTMLVLHMRNEEARCETEGSDTGMKRSDVITWYLEQVADQIESEDELISRKTLIEKVLDRLIYHDQLIIPLKTTELRQPGKSPRSTTEEEEEEDPLLVVHPNYIIE